MWLNLKTSNIESFKDSRMFKQAPLVNNCRASLQEKHILTCLTSWCVSTPLVYIHPKEMKKGCANIAFVIITKNCEQCLLINILQILILWSRAQQLKGTRAWWLQWRQVHTQSYKSMALSTCHHELQKYRSKVQAEVKNRMQSLIQRGWSNALMMNSFTLHCENY